jgi:tRNA-uridine 2-sulfurtransferase
MSNQTTVFVGLSGGVDSSVAALRLQQRGFNVVGVFIKVWHPDFLVCNWEQERLDAMRVAAHLNIPFLTCDAETAYRDDVAKYFISEYLAGRTPNPDVMCNKHVKFGAFLDFAKSYGADYIATGHYARRTSGPSGTRLERGVDTKKDQSYFLWTLTPEQLAYTLLPVGDSTKDVIRAEAKAAGIPTAQKKDSQGVCFLGHIDIKDFLSHYTKLEVGPVVTAGGEVVGRHDGALIYTPGQRHGFTINTSEENRSPYYVIGKDIIKNTVTVAKSRPEWPIGTGISLSQLTLRTKVTTGDTLQAQIRYRQKPFKVSVTHVSDDLLVVSPVETTERGAVGQSCVLYTDDICHGGGIIV